MANTFGKQCLGFAAIALACALHAQAPDVFNFENATKVSELPEPVALGKSSPPSMQKQYYLDPAQQLFTASELKEAYTQMANLRVFYGASHNAPSLWAKTRDLLFSDKFIYVGKCESLSEGVLNGRKADVKLDYTRKLQEVFGLEHYTELKFCLEYLGINYSDWELWQAYVEDRKNLIEETKSLPQITNRLRAFILAVDIRYTLCMPNDAISGFLPLQTDVNAK